MCSKIALESHMDHLSTASILGMAASPAVGNHAKCYAGILPDE